MVKIAKSTAVRSLKNYLESFLGRFLSVRERHNGEQPSMMSSPPTVVMTVTKKYDVSYNSARLEWIPRRAEMDISFHVDQPVGNGQLCDLEIELKSGPSILYRYFPFSACIYVDDRAAAVLEFSAPLEAQGVTVEVPASRPFRLTVVSELPQSLQRPQPERPDQALLLSAMRPGPLLALKLAPAASIAPASDFFSQQRVALVDKLPEPVFVVGPYRTGTSILTWALGQHPSIWPLPETVWLPHLGTGAVGGYWLGTRPPRNYFGLCDVTIEEYLAHLGCSIDDLIKKTTLRRLSRSHFERLHPKSDVDTTHNEMFELARTLFGRKRRWVDGTPENAAHMTLLRRLFPAAKFVCTVRNPVDVIASMVHFEKAGGQHAPIVEAAAMWRRMTDWTLLGGRAFGSEIGRSRRRRLRHRRGPRCARGYENAESDDRQDRRQHRERHRERPLIVMGHRTQTFAITGSTRF